MKEPGDMEVPVRARSIPEIELEGMTLIEVSAYPDAFDGVLPKSQGITGPPGERRSGLPLDEELDASACVVSYPIIDTSSV